MASSELAALLGAAVRAAVLAKAPRRTVSAVAAAVTGALLQGKPGLTPTGSRAGAASKRAATPSCDVSPETPASTVQPEQLIAALREARRAQRHRKKVRRQTARDRPADEPVEPATIGGKHTTSDVAFRKRCCNKDIKQQRASIKQ